MTDLEHKQKKVVEMEEGNQRSYEELQSKLQGFNMDTSDMRRELFIEHLVLWGVISEDQKLNFEIAFHEKVEEALDGAWNKVRAAQKPKLAVVKKPSNLLDQHGRPL